MKKSIWVLLVSFVCLSLFGEQESFSEKRLRSILEQQEALFGELIENPNAYSENEISRRFEELLGRYNQYLLDNPLDVDAFILYGKYLRKIGQDKQAKIIFMRANKLNPNIAVVKQQLGNFLAEEGRYALALPYFLSAIQLEPSVAVYHYQLGELLATYKESFIHDNFYKADVIDFEMLKAFKEAVELAPEVRDLKIRLAQVYSELSEPNLEGALVQWDELLASSKTAIDREVMLMHKAKVLFQLGRNAEAKDCLDEVYSPALEKNRRELLIEIEKKWTQ